MRGCPLTLYTLTPVCKFSILLFQIFPRVLSRRNCLTIRNVSNLSIFFLNWNFPQKLWIILSTVADNASNQRARVYDFAHFRPMKKSRPISLKCYNYDTGERPKRLHLRILVKKCVNYRNRSGKGNSCRCIVRCPAGIAGPYEISLECIYQGMMRRH